METICAIIVTFNRCKLLKECIDGVLSQSIAINKIIVVDNNSSDGTSDLFQLNGPFSTFSKIQYINLGKNTGGAGGFHAGVKEAYSQGYEWFWLMDDDIEPTSDCLKTMLSFKDKSKCLHPTKIYHPSGNLFIWDGYFDPKTSLSHRKQSEPWRENKEYTEVNYGCFEGMLIHKEIVKEIGFPDERFFIIGDDLIYGYLASFHTPVLYLRDAIFKKKIERNQVASFLGLKRPYQSPFTLYFNARNHFLKKEYLVKTNQSSLLINITIIIKIFKLLFEVILFFRTKDHYLRLTKGTKDGITHNWRGHEYFISR